MAQFVDIILFKTWELNFSDFIFYSFYQILISFFLFPENKII